MFNLALESAMRLREMFTLTLDQVDFDRRTIFLLKTKNGDKRQVPITSVATSSLQCYMELVASGCEEMMGWRHNENLLFPFWDGDELEKKASSRMSRLYKRIFEAAMCEDFTFHDLRHEATSRLFERTSLTELEIAKITGHKSIKMLARYANLRGSNLADRLW
jgi:integrase